MPFDRPFFVRVAFVWLCAALLAVSAAAAEAPQKVVAIEGVTEYRLDNGLRVLTVPDPGADTVTVHITYLVGSRHEGYGERGMAHLLEHMLFKGSARHADLKREFAGRGARWNGTTAYDRTNYFETMPASDANLDWALGMEADRMVNSFIAKADLESEMTVVRNEFEMGENDPGGVLFQRTLQLAYAWHNYGHPIIGARSDIESVPIARLQAFYRTWYQPDNALLIVAGRFDQARALGLVQKYFGAIPRPARTLPALYTQEPEQDGARAVTLRRNGEAPIVTALYRIPAGSDPDYPALDVLVNVLGNTPSGRLHRALVQKGLANYAWGSERALHDPGFASFGAGLPKDASVDAARDALLGALERIGKHPVRAEEVRRAKTELLNDFDKAQRNTRALVRALSEFEAIGDWRLFFLYRDRLRAVSVADVQRVAVAYLKPANRVLGVFLPTRHPDRAKIPPPPDLAQALRGYRGGEALAAGEAFDPTPANIEARVIRRTLANGIRVALLPKKTRGHVVVARLLLHWGDEPSISGRVTACSLAGDMLARGTRRHSRAELSDAFERLNASVAVNGEGARLEVPAAQLADTLRLVAEAFREPAFPADEFKQLKRALLTEAEERRSDPTAIAGLQLSRHLSPYPKGHPYYTDTIDEDVEQLQAATVADAESCYRELLGATGADIAAVGEFDPDALARQLETLFGGWKNPRPFARVAARYYDNAPLESEFRTPDKANAVLRAGLNIAAARRRPRFPGHGAGELPARRFAFGPHPAARARERRPVVQRLHLVPRQRVLPGRRVQGVGDLRPRQQGPGRAGDPRGARARAARRLRRSRGRERRQGADRGASPGAPQRPRARRAAGGLPLQAAQLRLGRAARAAHRRPERGRGERGPAAPPRPRPAVGDERGRLQVGAAYLRSRSRISSSRTSCRGGGAAGAACSSRLSRLMPRSAMKMTKATSVKSSTACTNLP